MTYKIASAISMTVTTAPSNVTIYFSNCTILFKLSKITIYFSNCTPVATSPNMLCLRQAFKRFKVHNKTLVFNCGVVSATICDSATPPCLLCNSHVSLIQSPLLACALFLL